ncbi:hypothetical protein CPJCM30710_20230 [Clostridium polyendosporum]|uniref:Uncharacterized protein n=1 Tax=Clostridium polyendosporum TaxID=69208 RepID=A0A919VGN3_9CLOT|nr:hypothetical protein [Clostridium polyendosporum]GIM29357.1 hypothetical protein CPJCM30710_20230 [Clostridium polyendosporum]
MDKQYLQETKQLNAQSRAGQGTSSTSNAGMTSSQATIAETKQLNAQSAANKGTSATSNAGMTSSTNAADLQEAKQLNAQSRTTGMQ